MQFRGNQVEMLKDVFLLCWNLDYMMLPRTLATLLHKLI